jgi:hypothetical protein
MEKRRSMPQFVHHHDQYTIEGFNPCLLGAYSVKAYGNRRLKMKNMIGFIMVLAMPFLVTLAYAQSQAVPATQDPVFRAPFDLKLHIDIQHYYEQHFDKVPYVLDNDVYLFAGESFGVNVIVVDNQITGLTYQPDLKKCDIVFSFTQEKVHKDQMMMMLVTQSRLQHRLLLDALMTVPDQKGIFKTSILPIEPKLSSFESWPHPIVQLVLRNLRFVERTTPVAH